MVIEKQFLSFDNVRTTYILALQYRKTPQNYFLLQDIFHKTSGNNNSLTIYKKRKNSTDLTLMSQENKRKYI